MGIKVRRKEGSRKSKTRGPQVKKSSKKTLGPGPARLETPLQEGEVCIECFEIRVSKIPTMEFRIMNDKRRVLGMGTLFGPTPERTARLLRLGRVGLILCGRSGFKRLEPLR